MKILVVDDSRAIRQVVAECIKTLGHQVAYAENGEQCLQYIAEHDVDLILMDVEMPNLNGIEATKAVRELKKADWFPIIFLTTRSDDDAFVNGILAGGDAYLAKPLNPVRLQFTVIAMERIYMMRQRLNKAQRELQRVNQELERLSFFDQLTGVANRRNFDITLEKQFLLSRRNRSPLSLIICDIDYFKRYNDSYGHQQGDDCLKKVAASMQAQISRPTDLVCRYGGEEFAVILPDTHDDGGQLLAERMRQAVAAENLPHTQSTAGVVTISLGIATYHGQYLKAEQLIKAADEALYKAKELGRNRVERAA